MQGANINVNEMLTAIENEVIKTKEEKRKEKEPKRKEEKNENKKHTHTKPCACTRVDEGEPAEKPKRSAAGRPSFEEVRNEFDILEAADPEGEARCFLAYNCTKTNWTGWKKEWRCGCTEPKKGSIPPTRVVRHPALTQPNFLTQPLTRHTDRRKGAVKNGNLSQRTGRLCGLPVSPSFLPIHAAGGTVQTDPVRRGFSGCKNTCRILCRPERARRTFRRILPRHQGIFKMPRFCAIYRIESQGGTVECPVSRKNGGRSDFDGEINQLYRKQN